MNSSLIIRKKSISSVRGFSLIEILIVLALIGVVTTLVMSGLGGIKADADKRAAQIWIDGKGSSMLEAYMIQVGEYPKTLADLKSPPNGGRPLVTRSKELEDPWKKPYIYQYPGTRNTGSYDLSTTAPDGTVIGNWETEK